MPRLELNLSGLKVQRSGLVELQTKQRQLDSDLTVQRAALDAALRAGQSLNVTGEMQARIEAAQVERSALDARRHELQAGIDRVADGLLGERDPAQLTEALDGGQPIALLPMRLETRYFPAFPETPNRLRIRVYPDDINIVQHTAALTDNERQAGMDYWRAQFLQDSDEAERIARDLSLTHGRSRCAWILRVLTPDNAAQPGQNDPQNGEPVIPQFPDTPTIDAKAKQTRALLLPDRWCAIGYASGRREVFRAWGKRIPDELALSPDWLNLDDNQREALFDGERAWLVDFDAALDKGMALQVDQASVNEFLLRRHDALGFNLATDTLERLIVVGLEWTKDAAQSAGELAELLAAQRDSEGLGFVPLGTPTNNTELAPSGYSSAEERDPPPTAGENAQLPKEKDALQLLTGALGLPADKFAAEGIHNAHLAEQRTQLHMLNALWRGTFGHYLMELWNPSGEEDSARLLKTPTLYALRRYAVAYLRPAGALPLLRVGKQPYGVLPVVGKAYSGVGDGALESGIGKVLGVLRPIWEIAVRQKVPLLKDGDVDKAKEILQSAAWSQTAFYRDAANLCLIQHDFFPDGLNPQKPGKEGLIQNLLAALGVTSNHASLPIVSCTSFPPYPPIQLAGVPWVLADVHDPAKEAGDATTFAATPVQANYLRYLASNITNDAVLAGYQSGPALLQALLSYSVQMERHDAVASNEYLGTAASKVASVAAAGMLYVEERPEDVMRFAVNSPKELANVVIPALTGNATLGQYVAQSLDMQPATLQASAASKASDTLFESVRHLFPALRDVSAVKLSIGYLADRSVGELNWALKSTLDAFSYRLDAWYSARANRRLEQVREQNPTGVYVGGFAWVENLKADRRPDSDGCLLAPSLGQAASAALLRSGFMANHEQGAFNIELDSRRTRRALDILQGLTRDQPLAALYGYRIERGLRDALLGKLIWPLRLAYPWRAAGEDASFEPRESVGARDVVDGVALLGAWETDAAVAGTTVRTRLNQLIADRALPNTTPSDPEWIAVGQIMRDALDLADSVSDLLMAEGVHQIVQGNFDRASAAMAVVDKQSLPIEPQVARTPRGGASYTQRMALLCPPAVQDNWPQDRRSRAEPGLNAWLGQMLGDPARYQFGARVFRGEDADHHPIIDQDAVIVSLQDTGLSPLSAVLTATTVFRQQQSGSADTGFRGRLVEALTRQIVNPDEVTGLDIEPTGASGGLGLSDFEALATTLRALVDKARFITRKDVVVPDDEIEKNLPDEGDYPGVDANDLRVRADALIADFTGLKTTLAGSADAVALLTNLAAMEDFVAPATWPPQVRVLQAPVHSADEFAAALLTLDELLQARLDAVNALLESPPGVTPTHGQRVQQAVEQIKLLLGKDFPVLPRFRLGAYATEFNAALAAQADLTLNNPWQVSAWLTKMARVHEGLDRFAGTLSAHAALLGFGREDDFKVVQYPHKAQRAWAALPEAWRENEGTPLDTSHVPEELHDYLAQQAGAPYKDINRVAPKLALALHTPGGLESVADDALLAGLVCDEWAEFIPDRFQTAGIGFHYDAPGARPPQSILLALPPSLHQENWQFDQVLDVLHEAWDQARLRAVRPKDLDGGIGAVLPGNYLPQDYAGHLPSVTMQKMALTALAKFQSSTVALGKV